MNEAQIKQLFPFLTSEIITSSQIIAFEKDAVVNDDEACFNGLYFVLEGEVRVFKMNDEGKVVTLYHVREGETCLSHASQLINSLSFPVHAVAKTKTKALMVPKAVVEQRLINDIHFVQFMVRLMMNKLDQVVDYYEAMSFAPVKTRLIRFIKERTTKSNILYVTHQQIADEIGTSREVISRHLKQLEQESMITLKRGKIIV